MKAAVETVAWFALGKERDDYYCHFRGSRLRFLWLGWELATARMKARKV